MDERKHFIALDSLRGIAALAIAFYHYRPTNAGYLIVDFFFLLSGFVLFHSSVYSNHVDSKTFIIRRIFRLYPLHVFTLMMFASTYFLIYGAFPSYKDGTMFTFLQHLTLTQNIGLNPSGITWNYPSWYLSVQFWISIFFILIISKRTQTSLLVCTSLFLLLIIFHNTSHLGTFYQNYYGMVNSGILRGVASFILGILAYRVYLFFKPIKASQSLYSFAELLSLALFLIIFLARDGKFSKLDFLAPFIFLVMVVAFSLERGLASSILKPFQFLGTISYSIYLNQIWILMGITYVLGEEIMTNEILALPIYMMLLLTLSYATYQIIEKPFMKIGRTLKSRTSIPSKLRPVDGIAQ